MRGTHLVRPRPDRPNSSRTYAAIIGSVGLPGPQSEGGTNVAEPWLSADDIAAHLGVTKDTVCARIAEKAMPANRIGHFREFRAREIDAWVRAGATTGDHERPDTTPSPVGGHPCVDNDERGVARR